MLFRFPTTLAAGGSANGLVESGFVCGRLQDSIELSCGIGRPTENPLSVGPDCVCSSVSLFLFRVVKRRLRRFAKTGRTLSTTAGINTVTAPGLNLSSNCVTPENRPVVLGPFSLSLNWVDVRRLRRRKYAHRITNATTATTPREAPIAAAMAFFFEVFPVESPELLSDICVDDGSVPEDVIAGRRVAAAAVIAIRYQP